MLAKKVCKRYMYVEGTDGWFVGRSLSKVCEANNFHSCLWIAAEFCTHDQV